MEFKEAGQDQILENPSKVSENPVWHAPVCRAPEISTPGGGGLTCFPFNRNKSLTVEGEVFIDSKFLVSNSMIYWGKKQPAVTRHGI